MFAGIAKFILIALLLLAQGSLTAHELDLDAHQSNDTCEFCLLHSALDDTPLSGTVFHISATHHPHASTDLVLALINRASHFFHARAPPVPTFV